MRTFKSNNKKSIVAKLRKYSIKEVIVKSVMAEWLVGSFTNYTSHNSLI